MANETVVEIVYEEQDSVVVKYKDLSDRKKRTDIYHFDGTLYER